MEKTKIAHTKSPLKLTYTRRPGQSLDEKIATIKFKQLQFILIPALFYVLVITEVINYFWKMPRQQIQVLSGILGVILIISYIMVQRLQKERRKLEQGRDGEREVAEYLDNLTRKGCYVFHDIVTPEKFNIDHVIVSKYGVFALETKTYSKPSIGKAVINFDGQSVSFTGKYPNTRFTHPIQQALSNAKWLRNKVRETADGKFIVVTAIVVFLGWFIPQDQIKNSNDIWVMNPNWLESKITQLPQTLSDDEVQIIANAIRPLTQVIRTSN
jgi:hypothetical protein